MAVWNLFSAIADIQRTVHALNAKADQLMSQQDQIDADVQAIAAALTAVQGDAATLVTDVTAIAAKIAAGETVDTSALDALVASAQGVQSAVDSATASVTALAPPPAPPAGS